MTTRFELGDEVMGIDIKKQSWIMETFEKSRYKIYRDGFIIDTFYVTFYKDSDATLYSLRWPSCTST